MRDEQCHTSVLQKKKIKSGKRQVLQKRVPGSPREVHRIPGQPYD